MCRLILALPVPPGDLCVCVCPIVCNVTCLVGGSFASCDSRLLCAMRLLRLCVLLRSVRVLRLLVFAGAPAGGYH